MKCSSLFTEGGKERRRLNCEEEEKDSTTEDEEFVNYSQNTLKPGKQCINDWKCVSKVIRSVVVAMLKVIRG